MQATPEKVKHGLAAGPASAPQRADWTIDQGWDSYTPQQHAVWKTLYERQTKLLPGLACDEFVEGMQNLPMSADEIPNFEKLSETLMRQTGWQIVAVAGLVPDDVFFEHLANRSRVVGLVHAEMFCALAFKSRNSLKAIGNCCSKEFAVMHVSPCNG